jgi:UrcA family protein
MLLLALLAGTASSLATADARVNVKSQVVRYDDIRIISPVGAAVLFARLRTAALLACGGPVDGPPQLARQQRTDACVRDALAKAVSDVNHPVLTQYYESRRNAVVPSRPGEKSVTAAR